MINAGPLTTKVENAYTQTDKNLYYNISDNIEMNALIKKGMALKRFFEK